VFEQRIGREIDAFVSGLEAAAAVSSPTKSEL
jgi:hypothetical protein